MTQTSKLQVRATSACQGRTACRGLSRLLDRDLFRALGDANRLVILDRLSRCKKPCTVSKISCCCPVDISVVSRHLAILRDAGVVTAEKRGKEVYYRLNYDHLTHTLRSIADAIDACCPPATRSGANQ